MASKTTTAAAAPDSNQRQDCIDSKNCRMVKPHCYTTFVCCANCSTSSARRQKSDEYYTLYELTSSYVCLSVCMRIYVMPLYACVSTSRWYSLSLCSLFVQCRILCSKSLRCNVYTYIYINHDVYPVVTIVISMNRLEQKSSVGAALLLTQSRTLKRMICL